MKSSLEITVGCLLYRHLRDFLEAIKFQGMDIDWIESSGWFERDFIITGSIADMSVVSGKIYAWGIENDLW